MRLQGILIVIAIIGSLLISGCVPVTDATGHALHVGQDSGGFYVKTDAAFVAAAPTALSMELLANVKGSIYETGEEMTVFGTCLDSDDDPFPNSTALFSAWYPNGTQYISNYSMTQFDLGYFYYRGPMQNVQGTYLTQMECVANVSGTEYHAISTGEWQNPYWVHQIDNINQTVGNVNISIGNLSLAVANSFNMTFQQLQQLNATINQSTYALNQSIYYAAQIANASVDRNDSYLAQLILNLTGAVSPAGSLNYTASADTPVYQDTWSIKVTAVDSSGKHVSSPSSECTISTTQTPGPTAMTAQGDHFVYSELIYTRGDFSWTVACAYT